MILNFVVIGTSYCHSRMFQTNEAELIFGLKVFKMLQKTM